MKEVAIIKTGVANIASLEASFARLNVKVRLLENAEEIKKVEYLVLPGVGTFGACMNYLEISSVSKELTQYINRQGKLLAICCGFQVLFSSSQESPGIKGLSIIDTEVKKFPTDVKTPQFGWNQVLVTQESKILRSGYAYFANSYAVFADIDVAAVAKSNYGREFIAGFELNNITALQFHPELSGSYGEGILQNWLDN